MSFVGMFTPFICHMLTHQAININMKIGELLFESGMGEISALLADVRERLQTVSSANASPQDYINQVGLRFRLYGSDTDDCQVYFEIISDPGSTREQTTKKFERRIISAAISIDPRLRAQRGLNYAHAREILRTRRVGPRGIATLTNPRHWKLVSIKHGNVSWPPPAQA